MPRFLAAADTAVVVEFADSATEEAMAEVLGLDAAIAADPLRGVVDTVPTLRSLLVEYDPLAIAQHELLEVIRGLAGRPAPELQPPRHHEIAVTYGGEDGPDLRSVAVRLGRTPEAVVELHCGAVYRVGMIGNLPGLPYLLGLPPELSLPRLDQPRTAVAAGSVAIAGGMSCIYPVRGPGGWHVIGRTAAPLFDPASTPPAVMRPGDTVRFVNVAGGGKRDEGTSMQPVVRDGPALIVVRPGLHTTLQDAGRHGMRRFGVPVGGAADRGLLSAANVLVGNPSETVALEITHSGPLLEASATDVRCAVAGECELHLEGDGGSAALRTTEAFTATAGARLRIGRVRSGLRCYLAVAGGFAIEEVLGSRSSLQRGGLGWAQGRPIVAGDTLPLTAHARDAGTARSPRPSAYGAAERLPVRIVLGPQDDHFTTHALALLLASTFTVSAQSDRVGIRVEGPRIAHRPEMTGITSDGCVFGSIQVPGDGHPIILGPDGGTTGGYPKVATVIRADLDRIGQLRPGDHVRFVEVSVEEAETRYRAAR